MEKLSYPVWQDVDGDFPVLVAEGIGKVIPYLRKTDTEDYIYLMYKPDEGDLELQINDAAYIPDGNHWKTVAEFWMHAYLAGWRYANGWRHVSRDGKISFEEKKNFGYKELHHLEKVHREFELP